MISPIYIPMVIRLPKWYHQALEAAGAIGERSVFFVVGCQKSGTTWVEKLLDAHPEISCCGEGHFGDVLAPIVEHSLKMAFDQPRVSVTFEMPEICATARFVTDQILNRTLHRSPRPEQVRCVGDRTPEGATVIDALDTIYPGASFIHVIRDGRDGAVSGWAHLERQGKTGKFDSFAEYAGYFASRHWVPYVRKAREAGVSRPGRYVEVRYESLHAGPVTEFERLATFLGVETAGRVVEECVETASFEQVTGRPRGEEDRGAHLRKGVVGDWRAHFDVEAARCFDEHGAELLAELGYEPTTSVVTI